MPFASYGEKPKYMNIRGGSFRVTVPKETPNSIKREWKSPDGKSGVVWELHYPEYSGKIGSLGWGGTKFGEYLIIHFEDYTLQIPVKSADFDTIVPRLCACDLEKEITLKPYSFIPEGSDRVKSGVTVMQKNPDMMKVDDPFKKYNNGKWETAPDYPQVDEGLKAQLGKEYWQVYFTLVRKYLSRKLDEHKAKSAKDFTPQFAGAPLEDFEAGVVEAEKIVDNSLPF
jgi:hypothetical protein